MTQAVSSEAMCQSEQHAAQHQLPATLLAWQAPAVGEPHSQCASVQMPVGVAHCSCHSHFATGQLMQWVITSPNNTASGSYGPPEDEGHYSGVGMR